MTDEVELEYLRAENARLRADNEALNDELEAMHQDAEWFSEPGDYAVIAVALVIVGLALFYSLKLF